MPRLPQGLTRSRPLAAAKEQGREFTAALQREKAEELKSFAAMLAASRKYGPVSSKKTKHAPAPDDAVARYHSREIAKAIKGK